MKILFITRGFPSKKNPMDGNYEAIQAMAIMQQGHSVANISIRWKSLIYFFKKQKIAYRQENGIDVYEYIGILPIIPHIFSNNKLNLWVKKKNLCKVYERYVKEMGQPDIAHSHSLFISEYAVVLKERYAIPIVLTEHWSKLNDEKLTLALYRKGSAYTKADAVIAVSNALADHLWNFFKIKSQVIYNMVEDSFFQVEITNKKNDSYTFVAIGSLTPNKAYDILIEAFHMANFQSNVFLDIVGGGTEYEKMQHKITELNLTDRIRLHGVKPPSAISKILTNSDSFVLASRRETFGIVFIEALAKGMPVIATRCGGPEEFVNKENGILVSVDNIEELSEALIYMHKNRRNYNDNQIREYCYKNFSQNVIANKILEIYNKCISNTSFSA